MNAEYKSTDSSGQVTKGRENIFAYDITAGTVVFTGKMLQLPTIFSPRLGLVEQEGRQKFDLTVAVKNPTDLSAEPRSIGKFTGAVQIDKNGVYMYDTGTLRLGVDAIGTAATYTSPTTGRIIGTPPENRSLVAKAKKDAVRITSNGKTIEVTKYDRLVFENLVMSGGPFAKTFPETTVNGEMFFDYDRDAWYFNGMTLSYLVNGQRVVDKITGNIRWTEKPITGGIRDGVYNYDVRVNEGQGPVNEAAVFAAAPADEEAAFFASSASIPALAGTVSYKDRLTGETLMSSAATYNLTAQNINRTQAMALWKLTSIYAIGPFSGE